MISSAGVAFVVLCSIPLIVILSISRAPSYSEDALGIRTSLPPLFEPKIW